MTTKAILIENIETSLLDNIVIKEISTDEHYKSLEKLCIDYPKDFKEITLTDEEYNRVIKYKQEQRELAYEMLSHWHSS